MAGDERPDKRRNGPWTIHDSTVRYENSWIRVTEHRITHPGGTPGIYGVVHYKNRAIGVLPVGPDGEVWIVGQHRFPFDAYSWELPEGGGPLAQDPLEAARRELREETGLTARHWAPLLEFDVSNSVSDEVAVCFLAWGLSEGAASPEPSEELRIRRVPFAELHAMCLDGRVRDSLSVAMVLAAETRARQGAFPEEITRHLRVT